MHGFEERIRGIIVGEYPSVFLADLQRGDLFKSRFERRILLELRTPLCQALGSLFCTVRLLLSTALAGCFFRSRVCLLGARPTITQRHHSVKHCWTIACGHRIDIEIAVALELKVRFWRGISKGGLDPTLDHFERMRVHKIEEVFIFVGFWIWHRKQAIVQAYFAGNTVGSGHPVSDAAVFAAVLGFVAQSIGSVP